MAKEINPNKKATIYDIAREVGTSGATVSRVLSNNGYPVKEVLRQNILDTAKRMNYSPNMIGRMLKKNACRDIGVIIPTISNPFYPEVVLGIEQEARKFGYVIFLCNSFRDASSERKYIESLCQRQVKGIIISSSGENERFLKEIQDNGVNIVLFDQDIVNLSCSKVGYNYIKGGTIAVEYLIGMGHSNIAFITSPMVKGSRKDLFEGYRATLLRNNIPFREQNVIESETEEESQNGSYEFQNGKTLAKRFLQLTDRPTAIFCVNDMTAFGIIQELLQNNISVPGDVSVVGFDNIEISLMTNPPLTTIHQPAYETGKLACKLLLDSLEGKRRDDVSIILEPSLVERKSVMRLD